MIIKDNIKDILKQWTFDWNMYFLPKIQLDRKDYIECNSILEVLWLKWNRWKKAHILTEEIEDLEETLNDILENSEVETIKEYKKRFQAFYTPKEVAEYLVELAEIKESDTILEPSAWQGAIVDEIIKKDFLNINLVELNKDNYLILWEKYGSNLNCLISNCDFLDFRDKSLLDSYIWEQMDLKFDKIIANPPFSKSQDVKHILHMYELLNEWWRIVSIASSSIQTREGKLYDELRALNPEFIELPEWSFKESGTLVNTVIVVINKI